FGRPEEERSNTPEVPLPSSCAGARYHPGARYHQSTRTMPDSDFVDYYELLQISPNAELETINRVYKMLATRYHPDNTETGDLSRFLLLNQAYETLSDHQLRSSYNALYEEHKVH